MDLSGDEASHLVPDFSGTTRPDGNNVDLDIQMGKMVKNAGEYGRAAAIVRKKLHMMRMTIMRSRM